MRELYSKIILYKVPFQKEDNFHFQSIEGYLSDKAKSTFNGMTSYPISKTKLVRIPFSGSMALENIAQFNYCKIENFKSSQADEDISLSKQYYFVNDTKWKANNTIELSLEIDSINTLIVSEDLSLILDKTTLIERQHENRFSSAQVVGTTERLVAKVDNVDEGFSPLLYKESDERVFDKNLDDGDKGLTFALAYCRSEGMHNVDSGVKSLSLALIPSESITIDVQKKPCASFKDIDFSYTSPRDDKGNPSKVDALYNVIEFPYSPFKITKAIGTYVVHTPDGYQTIAVNDVAWSDVQFVPYCAYANLGANRIVNEDFAQIEFDDAFESVAIGDYLNKNKPRFLKDTKLLSSSFTSHRLVYDSFSCDIAFERCSFGNEIPKVSLDFIVGTSMQSTFGFKLNPSNFTRKETNDYPEVFMIRRNNEMPLVTDEYRNYLALGYNYDQKNKGIDNMTRWAGYATRVVGTSAVSIATAPITGGASIGGIVLSLVGNTINTIASQEKAELSSEERLANYASKGVNVSGSDDIGLLDGMLENKLRYITHRVSPEMERMLDDLFYYFGYRRNYQGIPNAASRSAFNFVQCQAKWKIGLGIQHREIWEELANKFAQGITFLHHQDGWAGDDIDNGYNLKRTKENWEAALYGN